MEIISTFESRDRFAPDEVSSDGYNRERSQTRMSVVMPNKGLINAPGDNNCFLNSAIQALWHLNVFRRCFRLLNGHTCLENACIFCALKRIVQQYQDSDAVALNSNDLRRALANAFQEQHKFQLGRMDDAAECFETILHRLHFHIANSECEDTCSAKHCLSHQKFAMQVLEQTSCKCKATSEPKSFYQFVHYVSANVLVAQAARQHYHGLIKPTFGELLKEAGRQGEIRLCPDEKRCRYKENPGAFTKIHNTLLNSPDVVSVGIVWDTDKPSVNYITDVMDCLGEDLSLANLFDNVAVEGVSEVRLAGLVTYYGKHYTSFFYNTSLQQWYFFDDARVREIGPKWEHVKSKCQRGSFQPLLVVYANHNCVPIDVSAAPREVAVVSREMFFPKVEKSVGSRSSKPRSSRHRHHKAHRRKTNSRSRSQSPGADRPIAEVNGISTSDHVLPPSPRGRRRNSDDKLVGRPMTVDLPRSQSADSRLILDSDFVAPFTSANLNSSMNSNSSDELASSLSARGVQTWPHEKDQADAAGKRKSIKKTLGKMVKNFAIPKGNPSKPPIFPSGRAVKAVEQESFQVNNMDRPLFDRSNKVVEYNYENDQKRVSPVSPIRKQQASLEIHKQAISTAQRAAERSQIARTRSSDGWRSDPERRSYDAVTSSSDRVDVAHRSSYDGHQVDHRSSYDVNQVDHRSSYDVNLVDHRSRYDLPDGDRYDSDVYANGRVNLHEGLEEETDVDLIHFNSRPDVVVEDQLAQADFERLVNEGELCLQAAERAERDGDLCLALHMCSEATTCYRQASRLTGLNESLRRYVDEKRWQSFVLSQELQRQAGSIVNGAVLTQRVSTSDYGSMSDASNSSPVALNGSAVYRERNSQEFDSVTDGGGKSSQLAGMYAMAPKPSPMGLRPSTDSLSHAYSSRQYDEDSLPAMLARLTTYDAEASAFVPSAALSSTHHPPSTRIRWVVDGPNRDLSKIRNDPDSYGVGRHENDSDDYARSGRTVDKDGGVVGAIQASEQNLYENSYDDNLSRTSRPASRSLSYEQAHEDDVSESYYTKPTYGTSIYLCRPSISATSRDVPQPPSYEEALEQPNSWTPRQSRPSLTAAQRVGSVNSVSSNRSGHSASSATLSSSSHAASASCWQCGRPFAGAKDYCQRCTSEYL